MNQSNEWIVESQWVWSESQSKSESGSEFQDLSSMNTAPKALDLTIKEGSGQSSKTLKASLDYVKAYRPVAWFWLLLAWLFFWGAGAVCHCFCRCLPIQFCPVYLNSHSNSEFWILISFIMSLSRSRWLHKRAEWVRHTSFWRMSPAKTLRLSFGKR